MTGTSKTALLYLEASTQEEGQISMRLQGNPKDSEEEYGTIPGGPVKSAYGLFLRAVIALVRFIRLEPYLTNNPLLPKRMTYGGTGCGTARRIIRDAVNCRRRCANSTRTGW